MPLLIVPQREPGARILFGSVVACSLLGVGLRALGSGDEVASVVALLGSTVSIITIDLLYRRRRGVRAWDTQCSTVWFIPTWIWGLFVLALLPVFLDAG